MVRFFLRRLAFCWVVSFQVILRLQFFNEMWFGANGGSDRTVFVVWAVSSLVIAAGHDGVAEGRHRSSTESRLVK